MHVTNKQFSDKFDNGTKKTKNIKLITYYV